MKKTQRKIKLPSLCKGGKVSSRSHDSFFECLFRRSTKKDPMEAWPTSPVLHNEGGNTREKERAHRYYERQLKACSWYSRIPSQPRAWIEVAESADGSDSCSETWYEEPCGCVLVSSQQADGGDPDQKRPTVQAGRSSFGDVLSVESRTSKTSRTSTEDEKSFYDNLCQFCKYTSLERRARKYGEWRQRWSEKLENLKGEEAPKTCTCAMDNLSFIEWKQLFEQEEMVLLSKADNDNHRGQGEMVSTSDYGTQKSKDSGSTAVCGEFPVCVTVQSSSLGYNSSSSAPNTEQELDTDWSYSTTETDSEGSGNEIDWCSTGERTGSNTTTLEKPILSGGPARTPHVFHGLRGNGDRFVNDHEVIGDKSPKRHQEKCTALDKSKSKCRTKNTRNKTWKTPSSKTRSNKTHRITHKHKTPDSLAVETTFLPERKTSFSEGSTLYSEGDTSYSEDRKLGVEDDGIASSRVTPIEEDISSPVPVQNDETFPDDLLTEFLEIAKSIDEFYESIHAKQFLKNRRVTTSRDSAVATSHDSVVGTSRDSVVGTSRDSVVGTSRDSVVTSSRDSVENAGEKREAFSLELRRRIRSLERLCSFVEHSDEETFEKPQSQWKSKQLSSIDKEEQPVWKLSHQSMNLVLARRSRSNTSSGSSASHSRCTSTSGSASSNSRCSTRQGNHRNEKPSVTSIENIRSPDSGFSERTGSFPTLNSPGACQLGTKWTGSMQWDYTDWYFYYGYDTDGNGTAVREEKNLSTIHEIPQDPLDWDF